MIRHTAWFSRIPSRAFLAARAAGMRSCFIPDTIIPDAEMKAAIDMQRNSLLDVIDILKENREGHGQDC